MNSRNVTVRLIAIDHDPLPYIQAEITAIGPGAAPSYSFSMGVRSLPFEALDGSLGPMSQPWLWGGAGAERWVKGRAPWPPLGKLVQAADGTWSTTAGFPRISGAEVGDALTVMLRQWHTYVIGNSSSVLSEDVIIYSAKSLNFYELDGGGGHVYRRVKNLRRDGQLISANADCFHSIDVAVGPTIVDSALGYCLDDFFNIHNSIHVLLPPVPTALTSYASPLSPSSPPPPPPSSNTISATLVNPRISVVVSGSAENVSTLDQTYGTTSPMSNIQVRTYAWRHAAAPAGPGLEWADLRQLRPECFPLPNPP